MGREWQDEVWWCYNLILMKRNTQMWTNVGITLDNITPKTLLAWDSVNDRIVIARAANETHQVYNNPSIWTNKLSRQQWKEYILGAGAQVSDDMPNHDVKLTIGNFNAQISNNSNGWEGIMGTVTEGIWTNNGKWLLDICGTITLKIEGNLFHHKRIDTLTCRSPNNLSPRQAMCVNLRDKHLLWGTSESAEVQILAPIITF